MAGGKYYYRVKAYLANYERNMREKGYKRCQVWATPEQWAVILAFANQIKRIRHPEKIVGLDILDNHRTFKLVMKDSVKQTDQEFFEKKYGKNYDDIPLLNEGDEISDEVKEYVKNREVQ